MEIIKVKPEILAIVQARGGSKSIPRKNLKNLARYPLIAYSIAAGLNTKSVTRLIVSTDDPEIAEIAREYGAEVPFLRPPELAQDDSTDYELFEHAIEWLRKNERYNPDYIVQLRPTSPIRPPGLIDLAVNELKDNSRADSIRSVSPPGQNPFKMWKMKTNGFLEPLIKTEYKEAYNMPRQHLPEVLWHTGHIDIFRLTTLTEKHSITGECILPLLVERKYCVDIDTDEDWRFAEWLVESNKINIERPKTINRKNLPQKIEAVVFDFDGVFTDNSVWVLEDGTEAVVCSRSDGLGLEKLRKTGIKIIVLSTEENPVVSARCRKLGIECYQGLGQNKQEIYLDILIKNNMNAENTVYVGNDINDLECMKIAGCAIAVADAYPNVRKIADFVLLKDGGKGAVRELCELIIDNLV